MSGPDNLDEDLLVGAEGGVDEVEPALKLSPSDKRRKPGRPPKHRKESPSTDEEKINFKAHLALRDEEI